MELGTPAIARHTTATLAGWLNISPTNQGSADSFGMTISFTNTYITRVDPATPASPGSPDYDGARSIASKSADDYYHQHGCHQIQQIMGGRKQTNASNDVNYWRDPLPNLSDLSDEDENTIMMRQRTRLNLHQLFPSDRAKGSSSGKMQKRPIPQIVTRIHMQACHRNGRKRRGQLR